MQRTRMVGNYVEHLAKERGISNAALCETLACDQTSLLAFLKGRRLASFPQLSALAETLGVSAAELIEGDAGQYEKTVVHCMNQFSKADHREEILDLIDDYLDVLDAVEASES